MGYINKITITDNGTHLIEPTLYAVASGTASAITASIDGFEAVSGVIVYITMTADNNANATLNVSSTGAVAIYYAGSAITSSKLINGRTYGFVYDGTINAEKWILIGDSLDYVLKSGDNMTGNLNFPATNNTLANVANKGVFWQDNSGNTLGFIKSNSSGTVGIIAKNNIVLRPAKNTDFSSTDGIVITDTAFYPDWETGSMSLGLGTKLWDMTWANGGYFGQKLGTANYQLRVNGGFISAGDNITGALQIKLPPIGSAMVQFKVILYNYVSAGYATYYIHGRTFTSNTSNWVRTQAYSEGVGPTGNLAVRFYTDITTSPHTPMVIIGETTTTWDYPRAIITEVYANQTFTNYTDNWNMSFITTLPVTEGDNITAIGPGNEYYPAGTLLGKGVNIFVKSADFIRAVNGTTIDNTSGTFFFTSTQTISQISSSSADWVGLQVGNANDKWQLTAIFNQLYFRQNDSGGTNTANWSTWTKILDNNNYKSYAWARPSTITDGKVLISNGTSGDTVLRTITDNTIAGTAITASTNLITANTITNWSGSSNLNTVGTVTSGIWNGTAIAPAYGGTGLQSYDVGDIIYASAVNTLSALGGNTTSTKKFLSMIGTGSAAAAPIWSTLSVSDISDINTYYAPITTTVTNVGWNSSTQAITTTINGTTTDVISLTDMGLNSAMHYRGQINYDPTVTAPEETYIAGDVVVYSNSEYVYDGTNWRELGSESSFKTIQNTVSSPSVPSSGTTIATAFIDTIRQDANGVITATKKNLDTSGTWSGTASKATTAADTSSTLYIVGVASGATTILKHDTSVTVKGGAVSATTYNALTLTAATTGFTIAGGSTTSKTLTINESVTLRAGSSTYLAYYNGDNTLQSHSLAHFSDEFGSSVKDKKNELVLGNGTGKASNGSSWGQLALYSSGTKGTYLKTEENSTDWYTAILPAKTGTIAYTSDVTASRIEIIRLTS